MTRTGAHPARLAAAAVGLLALCGAPGIAGAQPSWDEQGFSLCTATTVPAPGQTPDSIATTCCVDHAGVPTGTSYGVGCAAPMANPSAEFRPTIVMPTWPLPAGDPPRDDLPTP
jgi:hypothetical protein